MMSPTQSYLNSSSMDGIGGTVGVGNKRTPPNIHQSVLQYFGNTNILRVGLFFILPLLKPVVFYWILIFSKIQKSWGHSLMNFNKYMYPHSYQPDKIIKSVLLSLSNQLPSPLNLRQALLWFLSPQMVRVYGIVCYIIFSPLVSFA